MSTEQHDDTDREVPGLGGLGPSVARFDAAVDQWLETIRGNPTVDRVATTASRLGDWSTIWHAAGLVRALAGGRLRESIALDIGLAAESLIVNQGVKRLFRRERPTESGDDRYEVRRPSTSAFPSGHASAAAFAAVTLIRWSRGRTSPLWLTIAVIVGASRAVVRIHHASDVVGGAVTGITLARLLARPLDRLAGRR
ncbi:MAG: phosphatase PAP2 family protein [Actinobacteria bacterium]|jgi:membrane-associated phospholipid phosphatase|nr:phosphatase PAP2 family protein [Actinomycetota bacterium]